MPSIIMFVRPSHSIHMHLPRVCVSVQVIEGMGRAIHTNLRTRFKCDTLKLAMIKTERLAVKLFGGSLYDCMCGFQAGGGGC